MNVHTTNNQSLPINHYVDICPHCHHAVSPLFINATLSDEHDANGTLLDIAFKCTRLDCARLFIGTYKRTASNGPMKMGGDFKLQKAFPLNHIPPIVPEEVKEISPSFAKIFSQATAAEDSSLNEIAGVGYRKALEFLIKDFCIHKNSEDEDNIKSAFLGVVINNYVDDVNIKSCAKRAVWLGNDETHYVRKWNDKDINDLKILIELTCGWIKNNVLTEKYLSEME